MNWTAEYLHCTMLNWYLTFFKYHFISIFLSYQGLAVFEWKCCLSFSKSHLSAIPTVVININPHKHRQWHDTIAGRQAFKCSVVRRNAKYMTERLVLTAAKPNQIQTASHTEKHRREKHVWRQHLVLHTAQIHLSTMDKIQTWFSCKPTAE